MNVSTPAQSLFPGVGGAVLVALARSTKPRTGRELARVAQRSQPATQAALDRFVGEGLVHQQRAGRSRVYTLNREHVAAPPAEALANLRAELFRRIRETIRSWKLEPLHVSVFGSAARGDGTSESDIDLFVVRSSAISSEDAAWREQLNSLSESVFAWSGNHAAIAELAEDDLESLGESPPPIVRELRADTIELAGVSIRQVLSGG